MDSRFESVRNFQNFVGASPVRDLEFFSVLVRAGPRLLKFFGFGPWIPGSTVLVPVGRGLSVEDEHHSAKHDTSTGPNQIQSSV